MSRNKRERQLRIELALLLQLPQTLEVLALRIAKLQELVALVAGK